MVKNLPANAGDLRDIGLIPGLWRSPGGGHGGGVLPWAEEPGGLKFMGSQRVRVDRWQHMHALQPKCHFLGTLSLLSLLLLVFRWFLFSIILINGFLYALFCDRGQVNWWHIWALLFEVRGSEQANRALGLHLLVAGVTAATLSGLNQIQSMRMLVKIISKGKVYPALVRSDTTKLIVTYSCRDKSWTHY